MKVYIWDLSFKFLRFQQETVGLLGSERTEDQKKSCRFCSLSGNRWPQEKYRLTLALYLSIADNRWNPIIFRKCVFQVSGAQGAPWRPHRNNAENLRGQLNGEGEPGQVRTPAAWSPVLDKDTGSLTDAVQSDNLFTLSYIKDSDKRKGSSCDLPKEHFWD